MNCLETWWFHDILARKRFPHYWPFVTAILLSPDANNAEYNVSFMLVGADWWTNTQFTGDLTWLDVQTLLLWPQLWMGSHQRLEFILICWMWLPDPRESIDRYNSGPLLGRRKWIVIPQIGPTQNTPFNKHLQISSFPAPGARLNIKNVFPRYGDSHVKDKTVVRPSYL